MQDAPQDGMQIHHLDLTGPTPPPTSPTSTPSSPAPQSSHPTPPHIDPYIPATSPTQGVPMKKSGTALFAILSVSVILGGAATGFGLSKLNAKEQLTSNGQTTGPVQQVATGQVKVGDVFGSQNPENYKDSAEGYLEIGGIDGEGSHRLLREGGLSQTVYLTSTSTDLDKFQGMSVKVWGETFKGQKAGWLMDVGRVQIVQVSAQPPAGTK